MNVLLGKYHLMSLFETGMLRLCCLSLGSDIELANCNAQKFVDGCDLLAEWMYDQMDRWMGESFTVVIT